MFQFNVVLGILIAYLSNYLLVGVRRKRLALDAGHSGASFLIFLVAILFVPESPRWLIVKRGKVEEAWRILSVANGGIDVAALYPTSSIRRSKAVNRALAFQFFLPNTNFPFCWHCYSLF